MSAGGADPAGGSFADEAFAVTATAYERAADRWEHAVQAAIAQLFVFLAARADETNACVADDRPSSTALARRDRLIARFTTLLQPGFETADPPPRVVAEAIGGGIYEVVRSHALEHRLPELPGAVPNATVVALSPFLGTEGAFALATSLAISKNVHATS